MNTTLLQSCLYKLDGYYNGNQIFIYIVVFSLSAQRDYFITVEQNERFHVPIEM